MENDSKLPDVIVEPTTDIVGKDADDLKVFKEAGMPDIGSASQEDTMRMFELYLSGKSYGQISGIMRTKREIVLYLSERYVWYDKRREQDRDLEAHMKNRIFKVGLRSQDVMIQFLENCNRKFMRMLNSQAAGNNDAANQINLKEYETYLKTQALLQKSIEAPTPKGPLVGINVGDGATVTRTGENTIEVTPKQKAMGNMLKELADQRRAEEKDRK
jgi:hypothetical protein